MGQGHSADVAPTPDEGHEGQYALTMENTLPSSRRLTSDHHLVGGGGLCCDLHGTLKTQAQTRAFNKLIIPTTVDERVALMRDTPLGKSLTAEQLSIMALYFVKVKMPGMRKVRPGTRQAVGSRQAKT